jgi:RimJ/RimL family protein N-acetyltransferase
MKEILTERLILRNFVDSDAKGMLEYLSNPRAECFIDEKITQIHEAVQRIKESCSDDTHIAVCLKSSNAIIGELFAIKEETDTYTIGWNFNEKYGGKGYAYESADALFHYLFQSDARRIYAYVADDNPGSYKLCEKLGMRKEGHFLEFISFTNYPDGTPKYENSYQYAILKKEWNKEK